jgi:flagellar hook-length control protein FliK
MALPRLKEWLVEIGWGRFRVKLVQWEFERASQEYQNQGGQAKRLAG